MGFPQGLILKPTAVVVTSITFDINGNIIADGGGFTNSGDVLKWTIDDGGSITEFIQNATPAYTLINATASVVISSTDVFAFVTQMLFRNQNVVGALDIDVLTALSDQLQIDGNIGMTQVNFPINANSIGLIRIQNCNITGVADFSPFSLPGTVEMFSNSLLTGMLFGNVPLTGLKANNCNLTGNLDLSNLTSIGGIINLSFNPNLTGVDFPSTTIATTKIDIQDCNLTGNLDLSMFTLLSGILDLDHNANLTGLTFPVTSGAFTLIDITFTDITGTLDLSNLVGGCLQLVIERNSSLTDIIFPATSADFRQLDLRFNNLTGTINLSMMTGLGGIGTGPIRLDTNPNLTDITFPSTTNNFGFLSGFNCNLDYVDLTPVVNLFKKNSLFVQFQGNSMAVADVNHMLVDAAGMVSGESGGGDFTGRTFDISGTNAAPDGSSGGFDGDQAVLDLQGKGITVTTS